MSSNLTPYQGGPLSRIGTLAQRRRIDTQIAVEAYRHDRLAELVAHKLGNLDFVTAIRIQGGVLLGHVAAEAIARNPAVANLVANALVAREMAADRVTRDL
ncbi:MAG TPA: hypothetical protein VGB83_10555 [Actinomycetota bacterium]